MLKIKLETIKLPESEITCKVGLKYKEQIELQKELMQLGVSQEEVTKIQDPEKIKRLIDWQMQLYKTIIKEWDTTEPIDKDSLGELSASDINIIQKKAHELLNPESKKKGSMPEPFKPEHEVMGAVQ